MATGLSPSTSTNHLKPAPAERTGAGHWGVRDSGAGDGAPRPLAFCPFQDPRTPPGFAETPVFASFGARLCSARDLSVFHSLDTPPMRPQGRGVRKRPSDRLRRRPSRGPLSPLVGDTY